MSETTKLPRTAEGKRPQELEARTLPELGKPSVALVCGHFSTLARMRDWQHLEAFFNPCGTFRKVHLVAIGDDYDYPEHEFGSISVHTVRSLVRAEGAQRSTSLRWINILYVVAAGIVRLLWIVRRYEIDLVAHIESTPLKFGFPAVLVARYTGLPSVVTLCSDYKRAAELNLSLPLRRVSELLWRYVFRHCTRVRSKSRFIADFALEQRVPPEKISVIPNKENLRTFRFAPPDDELKQMAQELGIAELIDGSVVFLTTARLIRAKNLDRMLRAFANAYGKRQNLAYLIVGQGPLLSELERLAGDLGIAHRVRFLGYFSHAELRLIYRLSDVFLFPTLYEGNPRAVVEAMLSGLPVICSHRGSVCELVEKDQDGLWVDPADVVAISRAILQLADDDHMRGEMSQHRGFNPNQFSVETVSRQEADFYRSTIREYKRRRAPRI